MMRGVEYAVVQGEVRVRGEGGRGRGGGRAQRQRRQHGVVVRVAEERHAVTPARASVRAWGDYHAVYLCYTRHCYYLGSF